VEYSVFEQISKAVATPECIPRFLHTERFCLSRQGLFGSSVLCLPEVPCSALAASSLCGELSIRGTRYEMAGRAPGKALAGCDHREAGTIFYRSPHLFDTVKKYLANVLRRKWHIVLIWLYEPVKAISWQVGNHSFSIDPVCRKSIQPPIICPVRRKKNGTYCIRKRLLLDALVRM